MNIKTFFAILFSVFILLYWSRIERVLFPQVYTHKQFLKKASQKKLVENKRKEPQNSSPEDFSTDAFFENEDSYSNSKNADRKHLVDINFANTDLKVSLLGGALLSSSFNNLESKRNLKKKVNIFQGEKFFLFKNKTYRKWNLFLYKLVEKTENSLVLEHKLEKEGLTFRKSYRVKQGGLIDFEFTVVNNSEKQTVFSEGLIWSTLQSVVGNDISSRERRYLNFSVFNDKDQNCTFFKKIKERKILYTTPYWMGWQNKYYTFIVKPFQKIRRIYINEGVSHIPVVSFCTSPFVVDPQKSYSEKFLIYSGPKDRQMLKNIGFHFEKVVSFGFFNKISLLLLFILNFFYNLTGNYGFAIILLTVLVKILLLPLSKKSMRSMKKLQELHPHVEALRKNYGDNPQKMQMEMMKLYRSQKVNPMGGCLPVIAQMPIFLALFWLLQSVYELKGAPFFWVKDLSVKDELYILPVFMGLAMFLQQMTTPSIGDKKQKNMMMVLPVFMTFLFINFPAGLVLYWFINNLISVVYQKITR